MKLGRQQIVDEALALLNEVGIDQLSTRRLAERLGVQQPALYWHFASKAVLLDALNEAIKDRHNRRAPLPGESWREFMTENARSFRRALLSYRDGARVHAGTKPTGADFVGAESLLAFYEAAGIDARLATHAGIAIGRYVVGCVLEEQAEGERSPTSDALAAELAPYPRLAAIVMEASDHDTAFEAGLKLIVDGVAAMIAPKRRSARA